MKHFGAGTSMSVVLGAALVVSGGSPGESASSIEFSGDPPKPIAAWTFDNIDGNLIVDESGQGYNARMHSGVRTISRPGGGQALEFDGSGDNGAWHEGEQVCGLSIQKRLTREFKEISVEAWIRKSPAWWMSIVYRDKWDERSGFGLCAEWSAGKIAFGHYDHFGHKSYVQSETTVQDETWHHVVGTMYPGCDKGYVYRIYVDGKLDGEQTGEWGIEGSPAGRGILKMAYPNYSGAEIPYKGGLDGVAIYDVALTPAQVKDRFEATRDKR